MRTTNLRLYGLALAMAFITMIITGCGGGGGGGGTAPVQPPVQLTVEKYPVSGMLTDPAGAPISGTVTLTATDKNGTAVKLYSDKTGGTQLTTVPVPAIGLISFFVADTALLPVTVKVVANAPGRVSSSATITVDKVGASSFSVKLVDTSSTTTAGVASANVQQTASVTTGLAAPLTTTVTTADPTKSAAQVTIPASTVLRDSTGSALSGTVTATVTTFAPPTTLITDSTASNTLALESFPGGLGNALIAPSGNTTAKAGSFATAGFVAVSVSDASGKQATTSGTPFTIRMDIPAGTINPETGFAVVADGTTSIPIWTYNETNGTWKAEIDGAGNQVIGLVQSDAAGLFVQYTTNHFSYWNLDWHYSAVCTATLNLTNDAKTLPMRLKAAFTNGAGYMYSASKPSGDGTVTVYNIPLGKTFDLYLLNSANKVVATKKNFDWCAQPGGSITLDYVAPVAQKPVPVTVTVSEFCLQDPSVTRSVPSSLTYAFATPFFTSGATGATGSITYNLIPGTYTFYAYNRSTATYVIKNNVVISAAQTIAFQNPVQCKSTTGTTGGTSGVMFRAL